MEPRRQVIIVLAAGLAGLSLGASALAAEKKKSGGGSYIPMQTLLGTTTQGGGKRGVLSVDCGVDVPDAALRIRAEQSVPRLRAAYVQVVQSYAAGLAPGVLPSAEYLVSALQRQTDAVLGKPGARLLLGAVIAN